MLIYIHSELILINNDKVWYTTLTSFSKASHTGNINDNRFTHIDICIDKY